MPLVQVRLTEQPEEQNESGLFYLSDLLGQTTTPLYEAIKNDNKTTQEKIDKILEVKQNLNNILSEADIGNLLKDTFNASGAIKLTEDDYEELMQNFKLIDKNGNVSKINDEIQVGLIENLRFFFLDLNKNSLTFRNNRYHFLFDSVKIEGKDDIKYHDFTSVNDLRIKEIDIEQFETEVYVQFNRIDQFLRLFSSYIISSFLHSTINNLEGFCDSFNYEINREIEGIKKYNFSESPSQEFNNIIQEQVEDSIEILNKINSTINDLRICGSPDCIIRFINYLNIHKTDIDFIKQSFGIDINKILRKHLKLDIPKSIRKLILGLLDAKINILAFVQNLSQILGNKNFLDPNFKGDLVLSKNQVAHLNNTRADVIKSFKEKQDKFNTQKHDITAILSAELDININLYLDILLGGYDESYLYAVIPSITNGFPEVYEDIVTKEVSYFSSTFGLLKELYSGIETYGRELDKKNQKKYEKLLEKYEKKRKNGIECKKPSPIKDLSNKNYLDAFAAINNKLIRFHREEDNPLTIIKTAQNAFNSIVSKGYQKDDRLHIMSVNYGGSLVGYFAKHIFQKSSVKEQILITYGNIVYSIYDLKNANDFLSIIDYPFKEFMGEEIGENLKDYHKEKNHLLIFDDNTSSGKTLYNLSELAKQTGCYGKIDTFACRVSNKGDCYDSSIPDEFILDLVTNAATKVKKLKVGEIKRGYKEIVGTIIGKSLYENYIK